MFNKMQLVTETSEPRNFIYLYLLSYKTSNSNDLERIIQKCKFINFFNKIKYFS